MCVFWLFNCVKQCGFDAELWYLFVVETNGTIYHSNNKGGFCNDGEVDTLISNGLSVENKVKLSDRVRLFSEKTLR